MSGSTVGTTVVVPAVSCASSLATIRSLGRRGIHTIAVSEQKQTSSFFSRHCDERVSAPAPTEDLAGYRDTLISLARRPDVRTILPMREADVYVLSKYSSQFEDHVAPLYPPFDTLRAVHDRIRLVERAKGVGVDVPRTQLLDEVEDWNRELIVKSRYAVLTEEYVDSLSESGLVVPPSTKYLQPGVEPDREKLCEEMGHVPIVQKYVPGPEYDVYGLYDNGTAVATALRYMHRAWSYAGGQSVYREIAQNQEVEAAGMTLFDEFDWHGIGFPQFKQNRDTGEVKLLELNPRMWQASLPCNILADGNFAHYFWRLAGGESFHVAAPCKPGVGTHDLVGEITYLNTVRNQDFPIDSIERPQFHAELLAITSSLYKHPHFDYLSLDDPLPFAYNVLSPVSAKVNN